MKRLGWVFVLAISIITIVSCNKISIGTGQNGDITKESGINLMENMTINRIRLRDTINNIRGELVYARNVYKKEENLDLRPSLKFITDDLREFTLKIKAMDSVDRTDTNYYYMTVKSIYEENDIISVLYERKTHLSGTKDTLHTVLTYNYDEKTQQVYTFNDVFRVTANNLKEFNETFKTSFTLEELDSLSFNFEKDMVWLNVNKDNTFERFGQKESKVKKFLIDD